MTRSARFDDDSSLCSISSDRDAEPVEAPDLVGQLQRLGRVHAGGRLVEQQQLRPRGERAGDLDAAPVGVGQAARRRDRRAACRRLPNTARISIASLARLLLLAAGARQAQQRADGAGMEPRMHADQHVLQHGQVGNRPDVLEGAGDAAVEDLDAAAARRSPAPAKRTLPLSAETRPVTTLNRVVLPEPFGPMTLTPMRRHRRATPRPARRGRQSARSAPRFRAAAPSPARSTAPQPFQAVEAAAGRGGGLLLGVKGATRRVAGISPSRR